MARRTDRDASLLAAEIAIERVVEQVGVKLRGRGARRAGPCPFHIGQSRSPTLTVDKKANTWTCPTCAPEGQGLIEFVAKVEGVSKRHAAERLRAGEPLSGAALHRRGGRGKGLIKSTTVRDLDEAFAVEDDQTLLANVAGFYHRTLLDAPEALAWLKARGLPSTEVIERYQIGYANRTLGLRLPMADRAAGKQVRERLQRVGILRRSGHEHFNGSVVFPVFDSAGHVVQIYGRKIASGLRAGTPLHLYLHDDKRGAFNLEGIATSKTVILTEGIVDALSFWVHGHRNVTCTFGTELTADVRAALVEHEIERVLIAFDRDDEGDVGAETVAKELAASGLEVLRVGFPQGLDANEFACQVDDPAEALARLVRHPEWTAGKPTVPTAPRAPSTDTSSTENVADTVNVTTAAPGEGLVMQLGEVRWRIRGLASNTSPGTMRLNLMASRESVGFHVDVLDLYSSRHRAAFVRVASGELCLPEEQIKRDLGRILLSAELAQDELTRQRERAPAATAPEMTDEDRAAALDLLRDANLLDRVSADFERMGIVGERDNLLLGYLVGTSRKLRSPLALVVQSSPAAGKSSLLDAVLDFIPPEERVSLSALTGQALYYMEGTGLRHRVLSIAEEEGASKASYALKLLQSDGALTIASTGKDPITGRLVSQEYRVEGPVALMLTATAIDVDDELLSRCLVVAVDESSEQTARIHQRQRWGQTLDGVLARDNRDHVLALHRNAQRLLRPLKVVNPFASEMTFADLRVQGRRDHRKLLGLIEVVAVLHQHQRATKTVERGDHVVEFIEVERRDIEVAERLLGRAGGPRIDDLPPQTARLLLRLDMMVRSGPGQESEASSIRFSRRDVRERLGIGDAQSKVHLRRLVDAEFLLAHRAPHGRGLVYSLAFQPTDAAQYDPRRMGVGRGSDGPWMGGGWGMGGPPESPSGPVHEALTDKSEAAVSESPPRGTKAKSRRTRNSRRAGRRAK